MRHKLILGTVLISLVVAAGCSDDDGPTSPVDNRFSISQFPTELGMWWRYESVDTIFTDDTPLVTYDTIFVQVIDSITPRQPVPPGLREMVWQLDYGDQTEERHVRLTATSVTIDDIFEYDLASYGWPVSYWEFPMEVGSAWSLNPGWDTSVVYLYGFVNVPAGEFKNGYQIRYYWYGIDSGGEQETWLVPEVGIVYHRFGIFGMVGDESNSTWRLIDWFGAYMPID